MPSFYQDPECPVAFPFRLPADPLRLAQFRYHLHAIRPNAFSGLNQGQIH